MTICVIVVSVRGRTPPGRCGKLPGSQHLGNDPDCSRLLRPHPNRMILEPAPAPQPVRKGRLRRLPGAELQKRTYVATDDDNTGETVYVRG